MQAIFCLVFPIGVAGVIAGIKIMRSASRRLASMQKYEFENKRDGGVIQFSRWDDDQWHDISKSRAKFMGLGGLLLIAIGLLFVVIGTFDLIFTPTA